MTRKGVRFALIGAGVIGRIRRLALHDVDRVFANRVQPFPALLVDQNKPVGVRGRDAEDHLADPGVYGNRVESPEAAAA